MTDDGPARKGRKTRTLLLLVSIAIVSATAGAVGGATSAFFTMKKMQDVKIPEAIVAYANMPKDGIRPVDIAGITQNNTPINPCVLPFLEKHQDVIGTADWSSVRFHPNYKNADLINDVAFVRGYTGITRNNDVYISVPNNIESLNEILFFHELMHVAQYASGMDLPGYTASAMSSYTSGKPADENNYEEAAALGAIQMVNLWIDSEERQACHPDMKRGKMYRAASEQPAISYTDYNQITGRYIIEDVVLHENMSMIGMSETAIDKQSTKQKTIKNAATIAQERFKTH